MSPPSCVLWTCLLLPLLGTQAKSVGKLGGQGNAVDKPPPPLWSERVKVQGDAHTSEQGLPTELLDLDAEQRHRLVRGTDEDEQQSTFGQSFEHDFVTTPRVTAFNTPTSAAAGGDGVDASDGSLRGNASISDKDVAGFFNPFYPVSGSPYATYAVLIAAGLVLAVGLVGNMVVMCVVWNNYYMRSAWNYLLASMAFWDFLVLVLCLPVVVLNHLTHRRILGDITCRMVPYMEVVSLGITTFTLCALGISRFHAATSSSSQPKARRVERCRSVLLKLLLVWSCALLLSSPEIFLWQHSQAAAPSSGRLIDSCGITLASPLTLYLPDSLHSLLLRYHQGRMWWCFGCYFCLPVLFTLLCQMATRNVNSDYSSTEKKQQQRDHDDHSSNQKRQEHQAVERQRNCTLLALAVVYGVCALPEHVCNITLAYTHIVLSEDMAAMLALLHHFLLFFKAAVTPVLLLCLCKTLGQAFMDCCCCCCQECQPDAIQGSPGSVHVKLKEADETSILFDKAKDTSAMLSVSS